MNKVGQRHAFVYNCVTSTETYRPAPSDKISPAE